MLAPSNVWLNFSSCIVSGASGVKVPPAIKGSPFFRYCGSRIVDGQSRRNVKRFSSRECTPVHSQVEDVLLVKIIVKDNENVCSAANFFASTDALRHLTLYKFKYFRVYLRPSTLLAILLHINDGAASHAIATWTVYVVLQKYFDPGRRSSIEFHEMKPPLHASLRPFRKAPIGRIRGATRRDRVARNTCHRRKFRSCVVYHARFGAVIYNTSQYLVSVCIRSAADRPPLNGVRKVERAR